MCWSNVQPYEEKVKYGSSFGFSGMTGDTAVVATVEAAQRVRQWLP